MFGIRLLASTAVVVFASTVSAIAEDARDVVMKHLRGYGALDVDAMTAPFAEDAKIISPERVYSGRTEIREFMENMVAEFSQPGISNETHGMANEGNVFMLTWSAESPDNIYEFGVDTYLVEDGEIVLLTTAAKVTPK